MLKRRHFYYYLYHYYHRDSGSGGDQWEVIVVQFIVNLNALGKVKKYSMVMWLIVSEIPKSHDHVAADVKLRNSPW